MFSIEFLEFLIFSALLMTGAGVMSLLVLLWIDFKRNSLW